MMTDREQKHTFRGDLALHRRMLQQARPFWPRIGGIFLLSLLDTPFGLVAPLPLKIVVDSAIGSQPLPTVIDHLLPVSAKSPGGILLLAIIMTVFITAVGGLLGIWSSFFRNYTAEKMVLSFRALMFRHMQRLSLSYHDARGTSDSIYRILYDTATLQYISIDGLPPFVTAFFTLVSMFYVAFHLDRQLAIVAMTVSPVLFLLSQKYRPLFRDRSAELKKLETSALGVLQETLSALRVVKAFGTEDRQAESFVRHTTAGMWGRIKLDVLGGAYGLLVSLTTAAGSGLVLWIGVRHVWAGVLSLGNLLLVMSYLGQLYSPLKTIGRKATSLQGHLVGAERAFAVLDEPPDVPERPNALTLARASGSIVFRNVSFAYEPGHEVVHDVSFEVPAGSRVGISGRTGAGKSTLMSLLTRFYDPASGEILLDGVDLRDYRLSDLRNQFAIVLQEPVLFSTTIAENIAYARPEASEDEIVQAAKLADAHDFVTALPEGYQTVVGERGLRLSGGERQRIALARAFLKDAPILLLDEPTSSVDVKTEAAIMKATKRLMEGRTTFMIAHRLSTLDNCDIRLEMEHGRLVSLAWAGGSEELESDRSMFAGYTLLDHPATKAWLQLHPQEGLPATIETFKVKPEPMMYRMAGAGPDGCDVFAKRFAWGGGDVEGIIYQDVLPRLPISSLKCFGFKKGSVIGGEQAASWLFMEDARGEKYSPTLEAHRILASQWLADLHVAAATIPIPEGLPDRGPACYFDCVRTLRERIQESFTSPYLARGHLTTLNAILSQCDIMESHWDQVQEFCARMPQALVHGDLSVENVRVRDGKILVMDWETAGWGVPAVDFAQLKGMLCPDISIYSSRVQRVWPFLKLQDLEQLVAIGTIFRLFFTMACVSDNLRYDWAEGQMNYLIWLQGKTADWIETAGWNARIRVAASSSDA